MSCAGGAVPLCPRQPVAEQSWLRAQQQPTLCPAVPASFPSTCPAWLEEVAQRLGGEISNFIVSLLYCLCLTRCSLALAGSIDVTRRRAFLLLCFQVHLHRQTRVGHAPSCFSIRHDEGVMESNSSFELNDVFQPDVSPFAAILLQGFCRTGNSE